MAEKAPVIWLLTPHPLARTHTHLSVLQADVERAGLVLQRAYLVADGAEVGLEAAQQALHALEDRVAALDLLVQAPEAVHLLQVCARRERQSELSFSALITALVFCRFVVLCIFSFLQKCLNAV